MFACSTSSGGGGGGSKRELPSTNRHYTVNAVFCCCLARTHTRVRCGSGKKITTNKQTNERTKRKKIMKLIDLNVWSKASDGNGLFLCQPFNHHYHLISVTPICVSNLIELFFCYFLQWDEQQYVCESKKKCMR